MQGQDRNKSHRLSMFVFVKLSVYTEAGMESHPLHFQQRFFGSDEIVGVKKGKFWEKFPFCTVPIIRKI